MNLQIRDDFLATTEAQELAAVAPPRGAKQLTSPPHWLIERIRDHVPTDHVVESVFATNSLDPHPLHADNCQANCPEHGINSLDCRCSNVVFEPNRTPWRTWTAIVYLSECVGGEIVIGETPGTERRDVFTVRPMPGRLVVFPADRWHFHRTMPVIEGTRPALIVWFGK